MSLCLSVSVFLSMSVSLFVSLSVSLSVCASVSMFASTSVSRSVYLSFLMSVSHLSSCCFTTQVSCDNKMLMVICLWISRCARQRDAKIILKLRRYLRCLIYLHNVGVCARAELLRLCALNVYCNVGTVCVCRFAYSLVTQVFFV
jgi:hypothetical protein